LIYYLLNEQTRTSFSGTSIELKRVGFFSNFALKEWTSKIVGPITILPYTLSSQINVHVRLFILGQNLAKNDQNLAILCTKRPKLQACMLLFESVRLFESSE